MSSALFQWPQQAEFNRVVPKSKIYQHASPGRSLRERFVAEIEQIVWKYKLSPETVNLPASPDVPEIQVFGISLKGSELSEPVLRTIDKAIPYPIFYELAFDGQIKFVAAHKRPSDADSSKWVTGAYFDAGWQPFDQPRVGLPVSLDLLGLYEQCLQCVIPVPARSGETLKSQLERIDLIRNAEAACRKLEIQLRQERQFNRKVELNRALRNRQQELSRLTQQDGNFSEG